MRTLGGVAVGAKRIGQEISLHGSGDFIVTSETEAREIFRDLHLLFNGDVSVPLPEEKGSRPPWPVIRKKIETIETREIADTFGVNRRTAIRWKSGVTDPPEDKQEAIHQWVQQR